LGRAGRRPAVQRPSRVDRVIDRRRVFLWQRQLFYKDRQYSLFLGRRYPDALQSRLYCPAKNVPLVLQVSHRSAESAGGQFDDLRCSGQYAKPLFTAYTVSSPLSTAAGTLPAVSAARRAVP